MDARQELESNLRQSCNAFKTNAIKFILAPIVTFLIKVEALVGDIPRPQGAAASRNALKKTAAPRLQPSKSSEDRLGDAADSPGAVAGVVTRSGGAPGADGAVKIVLEDRAEDELALSPELRKSLASQSFAKPDRIQEIIESSHQLVKQSVPELRDILKV